MTNITNRERADLERQAARKVGRGHPDHEAHTKLALWFEQQAKQENDNDHN